MGLATTACAAEPMGEFNHISNICSFFSWAILVLFWDKLICVGLLIYFLFWHRY